MKQLPVEGHVEVLGEGGLWWPARVVDLLDTQFTAEDLQTEKLDFYFYTDKGVTWRQLND